MCAAGSESGCDECPVKQAQSDFQEDLLDELGEQLGDEKARSLIGPLQRAVVTTMELEETDPSIWSVATGLLVRILRSEKNRIDRAESWNKRKQ